MTEELFSIPLICETDGCPNNGNVVNIITDLPAEAVDAFFEDYDGSAPEDRCPACEEAAIALDADVQS